MLFYRQRCQGPSCSVIMTQRGLCIPRGGRRQRRRRATRRTWLRIFCAVLIKKKKKEKKEASEKPIRSHHIWVEMNHHLSSRHLIYSLKPFKALRLTASSLGTCCACFPKRHSAPRPRRLNHCSPHFVKSPRAIAASSS